MFCSQCGKPLDAGVTQCLACGAVVPGAANPPAEWFRPTQPDDAQPVDAPPADEPRAFVDDESPFDLDAPEVAGRPTWPLLVGVLAVALGVVVFLAYQLMNLRLPDDIAAPPASPSTSAAPAPAEPTTPAPEQPTSAPTTATAPPSATPTPTPSRTPTPTPSASLNLPANVSQCQPGVWVNASASCPFAAEIASKVNRKMTTPVSFDAYSSVTNMTYLVTCTREGMLITCANEGTSRIYIAGE